MLSRDQHNNALSGRRPGAWEAAAVFVAVLAAIVAVRRDGLTTWWVAPAILIAAGLAPFLIRRQAPPAIVHAQTLTRDLWILLCTCLAVLPVTYAVVWLAQRAGLAVPLQPARPPSLATWVAYQFLYVAVAEEIFFRGYVLSSLLHASVTGRGLGSWTAILVSSALFALTHAVVQGDIAAAVTFLPGLVLGWLYVRTGTLLVPILFHGIANLFWLMILW